MARTKGTFGGAVAFHPKVPRRWRYYLDHDLNWPPYRSEHVVFDVLVDDLTIVLDHLEDFAARIDASNLTTYVRSSTPSVTSSCDWSTPGFVLTPETFRSEWGVQFSARVDEIRRELGRPLPEQPSAYTRKIRRSIKRDISRKVYRVLDR